MSKHSFLIIVLALAALLPGTLSGTAVSDTILIKVKKIHTAAGPMISDGQILVINGKIAAVGKNIKTPPGARVIMADTVIPGLIDAHSHIGVASPPFVAENSDVNEMSDPVTPQVRAFDSFNFDTPIIKTALAAGITTVVSRPGSGNVIGGTSVAVKLKNAPHDEMVLMEDCDLKMAIEGNPISVYGEKMQLPSTLMGVYHVARKAFLDAQDYQENREAFEKDKKEGKAAAPPARDLGKEILLKALKREIPVHVHCTTASEIMSCIRLAEEFHLRLSLGHCYWAYLIIDELKNHKDVCFNVGPAMFYHYYENALNFKNSPAILAGAGLKVSLHTDTTGGHQQDLRELAALCVRYGMKEDDALKAITIREAEAVGLDKKIGSIEPGKDADLVILNGEPFEFLTSVEKVMIDGRMEYEGRTAAPPSIPASHETVPLSLPKTIGAGRPFAVKCGTLITMSGPPLRDAVLLVKDGKIEKSGKGIGIPSGYDVVDASGSTVMPGLVAARSYIGLLPNRRKQSMVDELSNSIVPEMEVRHAIEPQFPHFLMAREIGITTALITPGNANVIGGRGAAVKTAGSVIDRMIIKDNAVMTFGLGAKAKRSGRMPLTRMGIAALLRETLIKAQEYKAAKEKFNNEKKGVAPRKDMSMEALLPVLRGETPVMVHAEREDDIRTALRIADEFRLKIILFGAVDAYKLAAELRKRDIPVILDDIFRGYGDIEDRGFNPAAAALLSQAGVRIAFKPFEGTWVNPGFGEAGGDLLETAAFAVKNGLTEETALRAVTIEAAGIAGIAGRVGSLEPGKDADILILSGHPFRTKSVPEAVFIDGKLVFDRQATSPLK